MRVGDPPVGGRYSLVEPFGADERFAGGKVQTWRARDTLADRDVVLRVITPGGNSAKLFLDRALEMSMIAHPGLGMVYEAVDHGDYGIVVCEWIDGISLADTLREHGPLTPSTARQTLGDVAEAITVAHHAGLPIGGITADRVVLRDSGSVTVTGVPALFADERGDIQQLGKLLYAALSGQEPDLDDPDLAKKLPRSVPRELAVLCQRALDSDPARQLGSAAAFAAVLRPRTRPKSPTGTSAGRTADRLGGLDFDAGPPAHDTSPARMPAPRQAPPDIPPTGPRITPLPTVLTPAVAGSNAASSNGPGSADADTDPLAGRVHPAPTVPSGAGRPGSTERIAVSSTTQTAEPTGTGKPAGPGQPGRGPGSTPAAAQADPAEATRSLRIPGYAAGAGVQASVAAPERTAASTTRLPVINPASATSTPRTDAASAPATPRNDPAQGTPDIAPEPPRVPPVGYADPRREPEPEPEPEYPANALIDTSEDYDPWQEDTGTWGTYDDDDSYDSDEGGQTRRKVLLYAVPIVGLLLVILLGVFVGKAFSNFGANDSDAVVPTAESTGSGAATSDSAAPSEETGGAVALAAVSAAVYDPFGDGEPENTGDVGLSYDGDLATAWQTLTYQSTPEFGNLKPGVGIIYDLGAEHTINSVELATNLPGSAIEIRVGAAPDAALDSYPVVGTLDPFSDSGSVALAEPANARFVIVWFVRLVESNGGFQGALSECRILGA